FQGFFSERILPNVRKAVQETASLVLSDGSRIIPGYYTGCCSGWTATPQLIWDRAETDGFRQVECRHEENCRWKHWKRTLSLETLGRIFPEARPEELASLTIAERSSVGDYVRTINCGTQYLSGEEFRRRLCQQHNWNSLPGLSFSLCLTQAGWELEGAGLGHGIGLCQAGAAWLARQGQSFPSILKYYFPDLTCRSAGSFPLNGSRRFGGNIIDNPVNPFNFTYQTPGQSVQK
ncbi:MAG TPA: hypothetical protein PKX93_07275, partial [bacterium]|nr:hypothetical protein [bacterium]